MYEPVTKKYIPQLGAKITIVFAKNGNKPRIYIYMQWPIKFICGNFCNLAYDRSFLGCLFCSAYKKLSLISLYVTDDALAKFYICDVKFSQIEGMVQKFVT